MTSSPRNGYTVALYIENHQIKLSADNDINSTFIFPNIYENMAFSLTSFKFMFKDPIKAMIFIFPDHPFKVQSLQKSCQIFCKENGIFCYFLSLFQLGVAGVMSQSKVLIPENEILVVFSMVGIDLICQIYSRQNGYYKIETTKNYGIIAKKPENIQKVFKQIAEEFNPTKILGIHISENNSESGKEEIKILKLMKQALPKFDVTIFESPTYQFGFEPAIEMCQNAMGAKKNIHFPGPMFIDYFAITKNSMDLFKVDEWISLPFEESKIFKVTAISDNLQLRTCVDGDIIKTISLKEYINQEIKVTMKIDENRFYDLYIKPLDKAETPKPFNNPETVKTSETLEETFEKALIFTPKMKAKIILTNTDFSILLTENGETKVLKDSNGLEKTPPFISFTEDKPKIGEDAKKIFKEKPFFVVYDLIKLCSIQDPNVVNPKWVFELKSNNEKKDGGIIIHFETNKGKKAASPAFLMALIFRDCLSRIKKDTGIKINEIEIELDGIKQKNELLETLKEAANLVKIKSNFV